MVHVLACFDAYELSLQWYDTTDLREETGSGQNRLSVLVLALKISSGAPKPQSYVEN